MINSFDRKYSIVELNHPKLDEFRYCTLTFKGDVHDLLADELIRDNKLLSYMKDNDQDSLDFLKINLEDKLKLLKNAAQANKRGYEKNDGVYMNFLSFEALKELYDVLPLYLLQRSDIEKAKFGVDSVFYKDDALWIFEFKTSIAELNERETADKTYEGVDSLFCKGDIKTASLFDCKTTVKNNDLNPKLNDVLQSFIDMRNNTEALLMNENLVFNVCIVSPSGVFADKDIKKYLKEKYLDCKNCVGGGGVCKEYSCPRYTNIQIFNAFHVQLPVDFSLETLYSKLIEKIGSNDNAKK